jgi:transcription elongation factor GreA
MEKVPITKEGYDNLFKELEEIERVEVQKNVEEIRKAREYGDISENAEYAAAKEQQAFLQGKIQNLQNMISSSQIVSMEGVKGDRVVFGCLVHITDLEKGDTVVYRLVGPYESDPKKGRVSVTSPIGRGIIGKEEGDIVQLKTPGGERELEITKIEVID